MMFFRYLNTILSDSIGMAGLEIIRRVVGDSKVLEITALSTDKKAVSQVTKPINNNFDWAIGY